MPNRICGTKTRESQAPPRAIGVARDAARATFRQSLLVPDNIWSTSRQLAGRHRDEPARSERQGAAFRSIMDLNPNLALRVYCLNACEKARSGVRHRGTPGR